MDQPYQPPAAEPLEPKVTPGKSKAAMAARIMAVGAMVVGGMLLVTFKGLERTLAKLLRNSVGPEMPGFIDETLIYWHTGVVVVGMAVAAGALVLASRRMGRLALGLALVAIILIGGWAGVLHYVFMKAMNDMGV